MTTARDRSQMRMPVDESRFGIAAESIFEPSVHSQHSNYAQTVRSLNTANEVLIARTPYNGRMSDERRFFCLFVTFDFSFTILMWLLCAVISGPIFQIAIVQQIIHYKIETSIFDIIMVAGCRFIILLLFYAVLHMNHWCIVALSTSFTSAFLLSKVFLYGWSQSSQPVLEVLLILATFVFVWGEIWLLDMEVAPQEFQARNTYSEVADSETTPLLKSVVEEPMSLSRRNGVYFYTPMDSPYNTDDEN